MPPPVLMNFMVIPPGCGDSVADFWGWDAHEARLRCTDEVSGDMCEVEVPGWALKSKSTNYPDHGLHGDLPLPEKIPTVEPGIEPGTSGLVVKTLTIRPWGCLKKEWYIDIIKGQQYFSAL